MPDKIIPSGTDVDIVTPFHDVEGTLARPCDDLDGWLYVYDVQTGDTLKVPGWRYTADWNGETLLLEC